MTRINRGEINHYGLHKISCESIDNKLVDEMLNGTQASLFFSDPPWGDGNLKYWVTMNKKMSGEKYDPLSYDQLLSRIYGIIDNHVTGHIMIETGMKWAEQLLNDFKQKYYNARIINVEYKSGSKMLPSAIVYASTDNAINYTGEPLNKSGYKLVSELIGAVTNVGDIVIDPCCGMGYTLQGCIDHDLTFRGNEFNPVRLTKAINRIK